MPGRYRLAKFGKAYILFCGDKKVTIPASVHNKGVIELHDTIVSTEDGDAFEIKEHSNGQITFEEIPTAGVTKVQSGDGPAPRTKMESGASNGTDRLGEMLSGSDELPGPSTNIIRLELMTRTGKRYTVSLSQDSSIERLHQLASLSSHVPVDQVGLKYRDIELVSTDIRKKKMTLRDYNIQDGSKLLFGLRLRSD